MKNLISLLQQAQDEARQMHQSSYTNRWDLGLMFYTGNMLDNITSALRQAEMAESLIKKEAKHD